MAKKQTVIVIDDLDGTEIDEYETVRWSLDGKNYEIDLGVKNAKELRDTLAKWEGVSRKVARNGNAYTRTTLPSARDKRANTRRLAAIRTWAQDNGYKVSDRGRVAREVVEAYEAANN